VKVDTRCVFAEGTVPLDAAGYDGLVVMGGPMSAASDEDFPTRTAELALIADAVARDVPTLGVCLGAQLVAVALGGSVYPGTRGAEIGWSRVTLTDACRADALFAGLPDSLTVLQWHGDTFDLPSGSDHLMYNANYPGQAFRVGSSTWGVQFHLEVDESAVAGFLCAFGHDAASAPGGIAAIESATSAAVAALRPSKDLVLRRFAELVASHSANC
jgi:GMP synthase-like glutamine amidotransferase